MKNILLAVALAFIACGDVYADGPKVRSAQSTAEENARAGRLRHLGGHPGMFEGLGMASTKEKAYRICCYASNKSLVTVEVGYSQCRNGMWVCCRRYKRK